MPFIIFTLQNAVRLSETTREYSQDPAGSLAVFVVAGVAAAVYIFLKILEHALFPKQKKEKPCKTKNASR